MADNAKQESKRVLRVFLCHASGDKPAVRELYQRLCAEGIDAWLDEEKLLPGQDWELEIPKAVRDSHVVIVCLSPSSITKAGYVQKEIKVALDEADKQPEGAIFLIPARLEECQVPDRLSRWHWVNLFEERGYDRLMRALRARAADLGAGLSLTPARAKAPSPPVQIAPAPPHPVAPASTPRNRQTFGGIEFVRVPAGKFIMGSKDDNKRASSDEKPQHTVEIPYNYWVARYPVTNEQFAKFAEATQYIHTWVSDWKSKLDHPVVNVLWDDAMAYCKWLNETLRGEIGDGAIRLPTEAEWEKAARGERGNEWPWGNEFDRTKCNSTEGRKDGTTPVGAYSPQGDSPCGAADMAGNVWDWTQSLWGKDRYRPDFKYPYNPRDGREKLEAGSDVYRVIRGGSWTFDQWGARCACRVVGPVISRGFGRSESVGFRVVVSPGSRN
jgi:formylglycine-generating enzyme required for sulfatase activity